MKKLITSVVVLFGGLMLAGSLLSLNSCSKGDVLAPDTVYIYKDTCSCDSTAGTNLIQNSGFSTSLTSVSDLDGSNCTPWFPASGTPQIAAGNGPDGTRGYMQMWGNLDQHEAVAQILTNPVKAGDKLTVKMQIKFLHDNPSNYTPYTRVRVNLVNTSTGNTVTIGLFTTSVESYQPFQASWTSTGDFDEVYFHVEDDNTGTNSATWAHIDDLKLLKQ
jgi:hypothetical protein